MSKSSLKLTSPHVSWLLGNIPLTGPFWDSLMSSNTANQHLMFGSRYRKAKSYSDFKMVRTKITIFIYCELVMSNVPTSSPIDYWKKKKRNFPANIWALSSRFLNTTDWPLAQQIGLWLVLLTTLLWIMIASKNVIWYVSDILFAYWNISLGVFTLWKCVIIILNSCS